MAGWNPAGHHGAAERRRRSPLSSAGRLRPLGAHGGHDLLAAETQPRRAALIAATSISFIVIIASNARFASSPPAAFASA
jgi:hypothetical protein